MFKSKKKLTVFDLLIEKYAQDQSLETEINPSQTQPGQSVWDPTGEEYIILEDDPTTTHKVLMPSDQKGKDIPEGVISVDDYALSSEYVVQDPQGTTASIAAEFRRK